MHELTIPAMAAALKAGDCYTILTHRRPDGDTVGCAIALCRGLRKLGKTAAIWENPQFTPRYLPYLSGLTTDAVQGTVVAVDVASEGLFPLGFSGRVDLCIDHHASNTRYADGVLVEGGRAACGEILFELLLCLGTQPDKDIADALYIAISTDTGCFRYSNTTGGTLRTAASLMEWGADTVTLNRILFELKTRARLLLDAYLAEHLTVYAGGKIGICILPEQERLCLGASEDDADAIAGFARNLEGVEIGVMLRDLPGNQCKISMRTDCRRFDASKICQLLGGGGHSAAAGATVSGTLEEGRAIILRTIAGATGLTP
ncbi:MAG: DHH family phosphoesterase [Oscillospiraceae bacterium]|nr:DHH family phosphoesterase [Oscillospiraceae bacterium]